MKISDQSVALSDLSSSYDRFYNSIIKEEKTNESVHLSFEVGQISKNRYLAGFSVSGHLIIRFKIIFARVFVSK